MIKKWQALQGTTLQMLKIGQVANYLLFNEHEKKSCSFLHIIWPRILNPKDCKWLYASYSVKKKGRESCFSYSKEKERPKLKAQNSNKGTNLQEK